MINTKEVIEARSFLINIGEIETKTLVECLKVDFSILFKTLFPEASPSAIAAVKEMKSLGILKRMQSMSSLLTSEFGEQVLENLESHASDTVRGWAAFIIGQLPGLTLKERFDKLRIYADDVHFGVREWAWMSVRSYILENLDDAIAILTPWTSEPSFRLRRFAVEASRPCGVWATHIQRLKAEPWIGLPILEPLKADPERYVQDSVANWLNDAAKTRAEWVKQTCEKWMALSSSKPTSYIVKRALRSIK